MDAIKRKEEVSGVSMISARGVLKVRPNTRGRGGVLLASGLIRKAVGKGGRGGGGEGGDGCNGKNGRRKRGRRGGCNG